MQKKISLQAALMMLTSALIWGVAFVAQSAGMEHVGPFTFGCLRYVLGSLVLLPIMPFLDKRACGRVRNLTECGGKDLWRGGVLCGIVLAGASMLQQFALLTTSAGKAGFLTTLYIVFVPLLGLFLRRHVSRKIYFAVALAVLGMYLLCVTENFTIESGDVLVTLSAVGFALHILLIDYFSPRVEGVRMSAIQFAVAAVLCAGPMLIGEAPTLADISAAGVTIAYAGIMSSGVAYTIQIIAQRDADPTISSLILSLESVFAVLAGWLLLNQHLSSKELLGCGVVFVAVIIAQLPDKVKSTTQP